MSVMCSKCHLKSEEGLFVRNRVDSFTLIEGQYYCSNCFDAIESEKMKEILNKIPMTTTNSIDGKFIKRYIDIESVEVVMGTGMFSEFESDVADFLGARSTSFEKKLQDAKVTAFSRLRYRAQEKGGNAVVGVDIDYTEFTGNRIGVVASGTIVEVVDVLKDDILVF